MKGYSSHIRSACSALTIALIATSPVRAQTATDGSEGSSNQLEEIVVTAQKRGQNLQDVPLSVTAFTGDTLAAAGVVNAMDLQRVDPSLTISIGGGGVAIPFLRGIGNAAGITAGNESSVPIFIDDVYYSRISNAVLDLANIDRIEVLKGPQGTLFGRNASGGLINIFTRTPDRDKIVAEVTVGYANYDTISGKVYASTPLGQNAAIDFSFSGKDQRSGWGRNLFTGNKVWREDYTSFRSKLVADLSETTHITVTGFYSKQFTQQGSQFQRALGFIGFVPPGAGAANATNPPTVYPNSNQPLFQEQNGGFYNINVNYDPEVHMKAFGGSLKIEQELEFADLVSISAYQRQKDSWLAAGQIVPTPTIAYTLVPRVRQFTQEVQVKSKQDSAFDWIVGAYYMYNKAGYNPTRVYGDNICLSFGFPQGCVGPLLQTPNFATGVYYDITGIQTIKSYSGFGQTTFHVIPESTNITLGLRYTADKVSGVGPQSFTSVPTGTVSLGTFRDNETFKKLTYKVAVDHKFGEDVLGYVSFSRGYKSGTYNTLPLADAPVRPEVVQAYEVGLKSEFFDRRLRVNLALFQNDITDLQVQVIRVINGIGNVAQLNAPKARTKGVELSGEAAVSDGLRLRFGVDYLDAKYVDFPNAPFYFQLPAPEYGFGVVPGSANGNALTQAPKWKGSLGLNYTTETDFGKFVFDGNASANSKYYWGPDNNFAQKGHVLLDASIAFTPGFNESVGLRLWGRNLTGKKYYQTILENVGTNTNSAAPAAPRQYGVEVSYKF